MNVAIFGGTFDPVHRGHLAVARAAQRACKLGRIYFVPADLPPHKQRVAITPFEHRYAMLSLALRAEPTFVPSLMESARRTPHSGRRQPNFSIDTVRRFRAMLPERDRLFFLIGVDAFLDLPTWYKPRELMRAVEFIVVSRPGFLIANGKFFDEKSGARAFPLSSVEARVHMVTGVAEDVSSTHLRRALASGRTPNDLLDEAVVEYIRKEHLYKAQGRASLRHSSVRATEH